MVEYYHSLIEGRHRGAWAAVQRAGLGLLSGPYGWGVRLRNRLFDRGWKQVCRAAVPVISVGNLTLGGTGKTPCVEYLARYCRDLGRRVAILSRGYGAAGGQSDEALVLQENLDDVPHYQGADRASLAGVAVEESESEVLLLDDGFQHRRLARDLDVVLLDATNPWGHGWLFPRGLLREPPSSVRRADLIMLTRCDQAAAGRLDELRRQVSRLAPDKPVVETCHRACELVNAAKGTRPLDGLAGRPVLAFCGIGNPESFRQTLVGLGANVVGFRSYPDHHDYRRADIDELRTWARGHAKDCVTVTTQKDLVKIRLTRLGERELWALRVRLHVRAGSEALDRKLKEALG